MSVVQGFEDNDKNYYYSVLNLPSVASDYEIRDRYRQLSIQFHPDKQHDDAAKDAASREFLKIQKAYQVLSDPFLRIVYDTLGEAGLQMKFPHDLNEKSLEEIKSELNLVKRESEREKLGDLVHASSRLTVGVDARSLFVESPLYGPSSLHQAIKRVRNIAISNIGLRHSIQQNVDGKTRIQLTSFVTLRSIAENITGRGRANIIGTIRHQFSPRLNFELTTPLISQPLFALKTTYTDNDNGLSVQTRISPALLHPGDILLPPCSISYSRRLFPHSATQGVITLDTTSTPALGINLVAPSAFDFSLRSDLDLDAPTEQERAGIPIEHGLVKGMSYYSVGLALAGLTSGIRTEWGVVLSRLALQLRLGATLGLFGLNYWFSGSWDSPAQRGSVEATVTANVQGVSLSLNLRYLDQYLSVPVALSSNYEPQVAFYTSVVPVVVGTLGYWFVYRPRQAKKRLNYLHKLRGELHSSDRSQEANEVKEKIIREAAKRHVQTEKAVDGLLIEKATYGCALEEARDLMIDVTAPLQSLVHKSQLYIPGKQPKTGLQGFYDPAPHMPKTLTIEYTFRGRVHHAQIRDSLPVVLPLEDHIVH